MAEYSRKQDTGSLKLLSIDQALEDIKEFINQMNAKYFAGTKTHWVTFGGSYPGELQPVVGSVLGFMNVLGKVMIHPLL